MSLDRKQPKGYQKAWNGSPLPPRGDTEVKQPDFFAPEIEITERRCHCGGAIDRVSRVDCDYYVCRACGTASRGGRQPRQKAAKRRELRGMVMPETTRWLLEKGHLYAHEAEALGRPNGRCGLCEGQTDLIWLHAKIPCVADFKGVLPATVWGEDVLVLCRCCSRQDCPHCLWHGEMRIGHEPSATGDCRRCGRLVRTRAEALAHLRKVAFG
jgi:hypothetical protein